MNLLVLGYSNLFKNRILPIIDRMPFLESISIAKFSEQSWDDSYKKINKPTKLFDDYESALKKFSGDIVYISTTNHSHFIWAKQSLEAGFNTIIDKPATLKLEETELLIQIAKGKKLFVSESTVYLFHPQMVQISNLLQAELLNPSLITTLFSFPPMNCENFRYKKNLGGGAFNDTGPYVASIGRFFFNELPTSCFYVENSILADVETSYSILLKYSNGRSLIGHFGFTTEYINHVNILGQGFSLDIDRVFTIPETLENKIYIKKSNVQLELTLPSGNMFENYFEYISKCLETKNYHSLYASMLMDSQTRELIIKNKNYGN